MRRRVLDAAFGPKEETVLGASLDGTISADGTLVTWSVGDPSLPALRAWIEANRFVRDLTCQEREQYGVEPLCTNSTQGKSSR